MMEATFNRFISSSASELNKCRFLKISHPFGKEPTKSIFEEKKTTLKVALSSIYKQNSNEIPLTLSHKSQTIELMCEISQ